MRNYPLWQIWENWQKHYHWVDLSRSVSPNTAHWSGFPDMKVRDMFQYKDGFFVEEYTMVSQYGTHIDAPNHFVQGNRGLDELLPAEMVRPLCVIDVSEKAALNDDYEITLTDVENWEKNHGKIPEEAFVALRTDWSKRPDDALNNEDEDGNKHYPGWSLDVLKFLVNERNISAIGHETSDTDSAVGAVKNNFACEYYILEQERYQVELMTNLSELPAKGALIFVGFPKMAGGPGFTARCIALCPNA